MLLDAWLRSGSGVSGEIARAKETTLVFDPHGSPVEEEGGVADHDLAALSSDHSVGAGTPGDVEGESGGVLQELRHPSCARLHDFLKEDGIGGKGHDLGHPASEVDHVRVEHVPGPSLLEVGAQDQ